MSDPVSNAEIEDVLSSLRRLIAVGKPDPKGAVEPSGEDDNKLLLTPAFRVFDGDLFEPAKAGAGRKRMQPIGARDIPVEKLGLTDLDAIKADASIKDTTLAEDDAHVIDAPLDPFTFNEDQHSDADMPIVLSDNQVDVEDNWEADAMGESAQVAFLHERRAKTVPDAEAEGVLNDEGELTSAEDQPMPSEEGVEKGEDITGVVSTVEDTPAAEICDDDFDLIDEGHLQELVARIVRDELKGEIGEKITQAVRRMVRREVTRALSLEKFD